MVWVSNPMKDRQDSSLALEDTHAEDARGGQFPATHWSLVLSAGAHDGVRAAAALERLCRTYWPPIYAFVRRRGYDQHAAEDLTQDFFAFLLDQQALKKVDRSKGKLRSFLLASLTHFLANEWDKRQTLKRGGRRQILSLDEAQAEGLYLREPVESLTPEKLFERRWATALLGQVLARLKQEHLNAGKAALFTQLEPALTREVPAGWYAASAAHLAMTEGAIKVALHRMRRRFGELLRSEVAHTVSTPEEVDEEIRCLFAAVAS
jgi:RNA polymerase sigma factor (sigma-70 family)